MPAIAAKLIVNSISNIMECPVSPNICAAGTLVRQAIAGFQRYNGLPPNGELDDATRAKLEQIHDDPYSYPQPGEAGAQ